MIALTHRNNPPCIACRTSPLCTSVSILVRRSLEGAISNSSISSKALDSCDGVTIVSMSSLLRMLLFSLLMLSQSFLSSLESLRPSFPTNSTIWSIASLVRVWLLVLYSENSVVRNFGIDLISIALNTFTSQCSAKNLYDFFLLSGL